MKPKRPKPPEILRKGGAHQEPRIQEAKCEDLSAEYVAWTDHALGRCDALTCPYCKQRQT